MDFMDLITAANDKEFNEGLKGLNAADRVATTRQQIIDDKIREFAQSLGLQYQRLANVQPLMYLVGGLVLSVRPHGRVGKYDLTTSETRKVLWQYRVALVGYTETGFVEEVNAGTLVLVSSEGVRGAYNKRSTDLEFDPDNVLAYIRRRAESVDSVD